MSFLDAYASSLSRDTRIEPDTGVRLERAANGDPRGQALYDAVQYKITAKYVGLTKTDLDAMVALVIAALGTSVTWSLLTDDYTVVVLGFEPKPARGPRWDLTVTMEGESV